jgi:rhodanese-related sulfurtransferase
LLCTRKYYWLVQIPTVTVSEIPADAYLLDVREDDEWEAGHAPGAAHLPMMEIPVRMAEVPQDRDVVVVCRVGGRSGQVVAYLRQQGWDNVINLDGGMLGWAAAGRPVIADNGRAPHIA